MNLTIDELNLLLKLKNAITKSAIKPPKSCKYYEKKRLQA
jgi:hypothetical protein